MADLGIGIEGLFHFDNSGRVVSSEKFPELTHMNTPRIWKGMHPWIKEHFGDRFQGTITHYDALGSALRTATGFCKDANGASTHFVIDRDGTLYQLASIHDRTWHAGQNANEWSENGGWYVMPNGEKTKNPNHWFLGIDLSNWGYLSKTSNGKYVSYAGVEVAASDVVSKNGRYWEKYTPRALKTYGELLFALVKELGLQKEMNIGHSDSAPKNKLDPGPALPRQEILDLVYSMMTQVDPHRKGCEEI